MERFLDFIFSIQWWQWLLGMSAIAGVYYAIAGLLLPYLKGVHDEIVEEAEREREEEEEKERQAAREQREAERREYIKGLPSGPVEPVDLPPATLRARNRLFRVPSNAETTLGTRRDCTVPIMRRGVSRQHAKIRPEKRGYVLYDLMSEAGTFIGDERIETHLLKDGDKIRLGPEQVVFQLGHRTEA